MSALSLMLQSSPTALPDAVPVDAQPLADAANAASATVASTSSLDLWSLVTHASWPVIAIMVLLVIASITSWIIIFRKWLLLSKARSEASMFESTFWSGTDLVKLYEAASAKARSIGGLEAIFEAGFRDFNRLRQRRGSDPDAQLAAAQRGMRATASRELDALEHNLELLANIGSTSPYIGLVGTVFGIMVTMHSLLASSQQVGIKDVAPGISEALLATAMGLFVAIPAVWAYNRYATAVERLATRYEAFAEEFSSILQRQSHLEG